MLDGREVCSHAKIPSLMLDGPGRYIFNGGLLIDYLTAISLLPIPNAY